MTLHTCRIMSPRRSGEEHSLDSCSSPISCGTPFHIVVARTTGLYTPRALKVESRICLKIGTGLKSLLFRARSIGRKNMMPLTVPLGKDDGIVKILIIS